MILKDKASVEIPTFNSCNLDCVYCYIPKNKTLNDIENKWRENNNIFFDLIIDNLGDKLESISFWGGEPTLGFKNIDVNLMLSKLRNVNNISTSTNLTEIKFLKDFLKEIDKFLIKEGTKKIKFVMQISIDGPENITDKNRGKGVYNKILKNLNELLVFIKNEISNNIFFDIDFKSTNTIEDFVEFYKNENLVIDYINNFLKIEETFKNIKIENLDFNARVLPTLGLPGEYTKEDGVNFYKYLIKFDEVIYKNKIDYTTYDQYYYRFLDLSRKIELLNTNNSGNTFTCSAGNMMMAIDKDGTIHGCHGSFWYNYNEYINNINRYNLEWKEGKRIFNIDEKSIKEVIKTIIANFRDDLNIKRLNYILSCVVNNFSLKLSIAYSTTKMLAISKQINDVYLNDSFAELFSYFITLENYCWFNNKLLTSSLFTIPLSIYRIYCNGAFEYFTHKFCKTI